MIPALPEASLVPGALTSPVLSGTADGSGAMPGQDFAGLLGAVLPSPQARGPAREDSAADLSGLAALPMMPEAPASASAPLGPVALRLPAQAGSSAVKGAQGGASLPPTGAAVPDNGKLLPEGDLSAASPAHSLPQQFVLPRAGLLSEAEALAAPRPGAGTNAPEPDLPNPDIPADPALLAVAPLPLAAPPPANPPMPPVLATPVMQAIPLRQVAALPARAATAQAAPAVPADTDLPLVSSGDAENETSAVPGLAPPPRASDGAAASATGVVPVATGATLAEPPAAPLPQPSSVPTPAFERGETRSPAPQIDSAIAQVGDLREALRATRPELTVRHADFGPVSLRLEAPVLAAATAQEWRAVLTSRDPGFVPAIQAALAERAVAPAGDSAATGSGAGQGGGAASSGSSEQPYGLSRGSGQGSSQPYPDHSRQQGGNGAPDPHGQQRRAAPSAPAALPEGSSEARRDSGLFA